MGEATTTAVLGFSGGGQNEQGHEGSEGGGHPGGAGGVPGQGQRWQHRGRAHQVPQPRLLGRRCELSLLHPGSASV